MRPHTNGPAQAAGTHPAGPTGPTMPSPDGIFRTWRIPSDLAQEIAQVADGLQVTHSAVVRELLRHALADVRRGRLDLQARPSRWELIEHARGEVPT